MAAADPKICATCTHSRQHDEHIWWITCGHSTSTMIDVVYGTRTQLACRHARSAGRPCGPDGLLYEPKSLTKAEPTKPTFLRRVANFVFR